MVYLVRGEYGSEYGGFDQFPAYTRAQTHMNIFIIVQSGKLIKATVLTKYSDLIIQTQSLLVYIPPIVAVYRLSKHLLRPSKVKFFCVHVGVFGWHLAQGQNTQLNPNMAQPITYMK